MDRRFLLGGIAGAAGVAAITRLAQGGPLQPPQGSPASSGRTLDEIYQKIPSVGGLDGRTPITSHASVIISNPGSYVLTGPITGDQSAIIIDADDVTLDMNGYTATAMYSSNSVISISGPRRNIAIRRGTIIGGQVGISNNSTDCSDFLFEDLAILRAKLAGIFLPALMRCPVIRYCRISQIGSSTTSDDFSPQIFGILCSGHGSHISDCSVRGLVNNGTGGTRCGIAVAATSVVARCLVAADTPVVGRGIDIGGNCVYRDNTVINFSTPYSTFVPTIGDGNLST